MQVIEIWKILKLTKNTVRVIDVYPLELKFFKNVLKYS